MQKITISLPSALFAELQQAASAVEEHGYGPSHWATDLVASELASRRLSKVVLGSNGPRVGTGDGR